MVRTMNNTCQYPSSCGTEVHSWGLVIGACYWHTRLLFATHYGAAGKTMMDDYLYQHFHSTPANQIESCLDMMLLNDNDANITNGTPDAALFYQGFTVQHSVPFPIPIITINHNAAARHDGSAAELPGPRDRVGSAGPRRRDHDRHDLLLGQRRHLHRGADEPRGAEYVASIPGAAGRLDDPLLPRVPGRARPRRRSCPRAERPHRTRSSRSARQIFFSDSFEAPSGWVSAQVATQDDWQNRRARQPGAPLRPADGLRRHAVLGQRSLDRQLQRQLSEQRQQQPDVADPELLGSDQRFDRVPPLADRRRRDVTTMRGSS